MDCSICLGEASDMTTVCNHSFHQSCIDEWLEGYDTCPYCRHLLVIREENNEDYIDTNTHFAYDSDSDYDYEDVHAVSLESIRENPEEDLYNWSEVFEL